MRVGDFVEVKRTYTEEEMKIFAELSGDFNPLHTDIDFAKSTRFGRPIVFGVLMNGWGLKQERKKEGGEEEGGVRGVLTAEGGSRETYRER